MKIPFTLEDIDRAERPCRELEVALDAELTALERQRPTYETDTRKFRLRDSLRQLRQGTPLAQGMDSRLYEVLSTPEMRQFHFQAPGLGPLLRLRERLLAEANPVPTPPVLTYRYTGPMWKKVGGQRRETGAVLQLTEAEAAQWAAVLELVTATVEATVSTEAPQLRVT